MRSEDKSGVRFKPVEEADLPRLNELLNDPDVAEYLDLIPPVALETTRLFFTSILSRSATWWVITHKGRIVGGVGILSDRPDTKLAHNCSMFLYLAKECWGRGIGGQAVRFALKEAKKRGLDRMEVLVVDENERALRLYRKNGFALEGVKREAFNLRGGYHDLVMMAKFI